MRSTNVEIRAVCGRQSIDTDTICDSPRSAGDALLSVARDKLRRRGLPLPIVAIVVVVIIELFHVSNRAGADAARAYFRFWFPLRTLHVDKREYNRCYIRRFFPRSLRIALSTTYVAIVLGESVPRDRRNPAQ